MIRTGRHFHVAVIVVLLVSAFLFLQSSWSDDEPVAPVKAASRPKSAYKAKEIPQPHVRPLKDQFKDTKEGKKVILDTTASSTKKPGDQVKSRLRQSTKTNTLRSRPAPTVTPVPPIPHPDSSKITPIYDRVVVVGRLQKENTNWIREKLSDWQHAVYIVDSPSSSHLHTMLNKGHDAMPYLTYLVEHYDSLPSTVVFLPASRTSFAITIPNEGEDYDIVERLRTLNFEFVQKNGFANLQCEPFPGCPDKYEHFRNPQHLRPIPSAMAGAWKDLFNSKMPGRIGTPCSGQFAVSREQILKRPLSDYQRYLDWLIQTPLEDDVSSRIFDYLWHVIFGQESVYCPTFDQCSCDVYKRC
ncbi:hypothetical protein M011DRAFT_35706 [Sporormia fimetaria CBS 119925]|uniref:Uncharacterized protein n=1 Tax=Sporormia fimetaria CBS 119925 TaxID=1340428 RepID=A0A6A6VEM3_9PLEO|nr:hypothetical protein M011DRAFT_35706 [Sporormia fimetaria CBS 119925]